VSCVFEKNNARHHFCVSGHLICGSFLFSWLYCLLEWNEMIKPLCPTFLLMKLMKGRRQKQHNADLPKRWFRKPMNVLKAGC
jgi:hypothetical protein